MLGRAPIMALAIATSLKGQDRRMTAEIAALNKHGVALASDSAVTITHADGDKVFNSANKLFALSKFAPVGIMIYGDASFMNVPWEPLIKVYRSSLKTHRFATVEEYATNFTRFIERNPLFTDPEVQLRFFVWRSFQVFASLKTQTDEFVRMLTYEQDGTMSPEQLGMVVDMVIDLEEKHLTHHPKLTNAPPANLVSKRMKIVTEVLREAFEKIPLTATQEKRFAALLNDHFQRNYFLDETGVVIAGFGETEIYPSLVSMHIDGIFDRRLRYYVDRKVAISDGLTASLIPFAQSEMVATFMNGINPEMDDALNESLVRFMQENLAQAAKDIGKELRLRKTKRATLAKMVAAIGERAVKMLDDASTEFKRTIHRPITAALEYLPKEELGDFAESLVHLTSLKRRVTLGTETVGGPIDVAVISKGDGFIWLKRKHYFRPDLNPQFLATYYEKDRYAHEDKSPRKVARASRPRTRAATASR